MADDERAPDFKDLLAAFDIPDVSSPSSQEKSTKNISNDEDETNVNDINQAKNKDKDKSSKSISSGNTSSNDSPETSDVDRNSEPRTSVNGSIGDASASYSNLYKKFKEEMDMYQMSTNALPSYMPPIPPQARFNMNAPADGFKCFDCNDTFLFEASLIQHLQRRSVYITFDCSTCKKMLVYYNRCSLLSHIRSHLEKNEVADVKKASVNPLPPELMNGFQGFVPPFPMLPAALIQHLQLQQPLPLMVSNPHSIPSMPSLQSHLSSKSPTMKSNSHHNSPSSHVSLDKNQFSCTECCQSYSNMFLLEDHFGCSQNLPLGSSKCSKCKMTCASKCSLAAHERIHMDMKPYVCPECGATFGDRGAFIHHVTAQCLHYSRVIGYKCSKCLILYNDPIMMRGHIISEHTEAYYKCQACPMAFKVNHSFETHKKTAHLTMDVECKTIYKCPLCDIVFQGDTKLNEHLDAHIKEQIQNIKFVFKCMNCSELFNKKSALKDHINDRHPNMLNKELCTVCDATFDSIEELDRHEIEVHSSDKDTEANTAIENQNQNDNFKSEVSLNNGGQVSPAGNENFKNVNGYFAHNSCGSQKAQCNVCNFVASDRKGMVEDGRNHLSSGVMVCLLCPNNRQFENKKMLFKHIEVHISDSEMICVLCSNEFNDRKDFLKHLRSEHGFNPVKCDMCDAEFYGSARMQRHKSSMHAGDLPKATIKCPLCNEDNFATQGFLDKHFILSHNLSLEEIGDLRVRFPIQLQPLTANFSLTIKTEVLENMSKSPLNLTDKDDDELSCKATVSPTAKSEVVSSDADNLSRSPPPNRYDDEEPQCKKPKVEEEGCDFESASKEQIFICSKCQFTSDNRSEFWKHIAIHKVDPSAYQCLECGSCFVTIPTLRKHMFLDHKIRDFDSYVAQVGQHLINDGSLASSNGASHNCNVCCQSFDDDTSLRNHMRNHGMAFVRSHSAAVGSIEDEKSN